MLHLVSECKSLNVAYDNISYLLNYIIDWFKTLINI